MPAPKVIPTVGRVMWFFTQENLTEPLAAIVTGVITDSHINAAVFSYNGNPMSYSNLLVVQDGEARPSSELVYHWVEWMPYQKGQAQKANDEAAAKVVPQ